jgi:type IV pilus assembly protein PilN
LIRINLLTEARAAAARKKSPFLPSGARLNNLILLGGVVAGVLYIGIMALILTSRSKNLDEEIARAQEEVARLKSIIDEVKGYEDKKASLEAKIQLINNLKTNQKGPVRLMDEISKALPDLVWLSDLTVSGDQVSLKGRTLSPNAVATYLENLKKSPFFAEPVFRNLGREQGSQGIYTWEMSLTFTNAQALSVSPANAPPGANGGTPAGPASTPAPGT